MGAEFTEKQRQILNCFEAWTLGVVPEQRDIAAKALQSLGVFVREVPVASLVTPETHAPCRIIDANGLEWKHLRWVNLDTGEAEQMVQTSDGKWSITADGKHVETFLQHLKTPITVVPLEQ